MRGTQTGVLDSWIKSSSVESYVRERQNGDGGYTFAQWSESSAQDTYFAIQILKALNVPPTHQGRTIDFLRRMQHADGSFDSINVAYYVTKSLNELGSKPDGDTRQYVLSLKRPSGGFGSLDVNIETSSELETTYISLDLLRLLGFDISESADAIDFIMGLKNHDGSFGRSGYSSLASVNYALAALKLLGFNIGSLCDTLDWISACEISTGGFTGSPNKSDPYLVIDDLYYGVQALGSLGKTCHHPREHLSLIGRFQNGNGGFRRSIFLGISTFEQTYYAISALQALSAWVGSTGTRTGA
jgi:hypothetical protein